jgi:hypothetical protein
MRISRGNQVLGEWSVREMREGIANATLLPTDCYYSEETSDWLPLGEYLKAEPKPVKSADRTCYCGSNVPFTLCCGDGSLY